MRAHRMPAWRVHPLKYVGCPGSIRGQYVQQGCQGVQGQCYQPPVSNVLSGRRQCLEATPPPGNPVAPSGISFPYAWQFFLVYVHASRACHLRDTLARSVGHERNPSPRDASSSAIINNGP